MFLCEKIDTSRYGEEFLAISTWDQLRQGAKDREANRVPVQTPENPFVSLASYGNYNTNFCGLKDNRPKKLFMDSINMGMAARASTH